ncbi:2,3-bisphosphoglycerate-dependent phosphoglycerate mutase [Halomonadaceae bacterium LMG 33818]|uniref:histidine phosphatase family protein n=1 Tax=Cernens ardua TaxID=3402176 RepID=UPI003EDB7658
MVDNVQPQIDNTNSTAVNIDRKSSDSPHVQQILCLRHGACERGDILRGRTNVPLSDTGRRQIALRAETLTPPELIFTSPLQRCQSSAQALSEQWNVPMIVLDDLAEMDFGEWDGKPIASIHETAPNALAAFWADPENAIPPQGESLHDFRERINRAWTSITSHHAERILVITHAGVIKLWIAEQLGVFPLPTSFLPALALDYAQTASFKVSHDARYSPAQWTSLEGFGAPLGHAHASAKHVPC